MAAVGVEAEDVAAGAQYNLVCPITWPLNPPPMSDAFVGVHPASRVIIKMTTPDSIHRDSTI